MGNQKYTKKEIELIDKALNVYDRYLDAKGNYYMVKFNISDEKSLEFVKEKLNKSVKECKKKIPKSLVTKFDIKKLDK